MSKEPSSRHIQTHHYFPREIGASEGRRRGRSIVGEVVSGIGSDRA